MIVFAVVATLLGILTALIIAFATVALQDHLQA